MAAAIVTAGVRDASGPRTGLSPLGVTSQRHGQQASFRPDVADRRRRKEVAVATARLPDDPSFEQLRKQAKDLRDLSRAGLQGALDLVGAHHPDGPHAVSLAGAQFVVARHYGFASWAALRQHVTAIEHYRRAPDEVEGGAGQFADEFLTLACLRYGGDDSPSRWHRAARLLTEHPEITRASVHAAAAAADATALE